MKQLSFQFSYVLDYEWLLTKEHRNYVWALSTLLSTFCGYAAYDMPRFRVFIVEEIHYG